MTLAHKSGWIWLMAWIRLKKAVRSSQLLHERWSCPQITRGEYPTQHTLQGRLYRSIEITFRRCLAHPIQDKKKLVVIYKVLTADNGGQKYEPKTKEPHNTVTFSGYIGRSLNSRVWLQSFNRQYCLFIYLFIQKMIFQWSLVSFVIFSRAHIATIRHCWLLTMVS